jgi:transposase
LVKARKQLEAQGRSLMVNHGIEPVKNWWKRRCFATLAVPQWMQELLRNSQPILLALQEKIGALTLQLQAAAASKQPRGLGAMSSVIIDGEIGDWNRFNNRRQVASYTGLCPGEYSSGNTRLQSCVTKHGNPRLRAALAGTGLAAGPLPARLPPGAQVAADPGQRRTGHWSRAQKSNRSRGTSVGRGLVENQNRPAPRRRVGINRVSQFEGNRNEDTPEETLKPLWNAGAARCLTCSESLRVRRLRLGAPKFLFHRSN